MYRASAGFMQTNRRIRMGFGATKLLPDHLRETTLKDAWIRLGKMHLGEIVQNSKFKDFVL